MIITILIFLFILSILVLVHELGHFTVAKILKIKVEEFGFGLPPKAFGFKKGETTYSINWLPIGGFVRLFGEDEAGGGSVKIKDQKLKIKDDQETKDIERAFFARPAWQRIVVIIAGVVMNFVLAVAIISYLFSVVGVPTPGKNVVVSGIVSNSPAAKSGLKVGDTVDTINGIKITSAQQLVTLTKEHLGEKLTIKIKDQKAKIKDLEVTPRKVYPKNEGPMGIAISQDVIVKKYPWYEAPILGTKEALVESWMIASGLGAMVYQLVLFGAVPKGIAGPVGIAQLTGQFVQIGPYAILSFISLLSLNLAILNILPIPALDGGRLLFIIIEVVTRRKVNRKFEGYAHAIGMILLLALIAVITLHDLFRLFTGQPILPKM
jgi:regulator of sigma E protease